MNKKFIVLPILILCAFCIGGCGFSNIPSASIERNTPTPSPVPSFITEQTARQIALEKAGYTEDEVIFEHTDLDLENGVYVYEIEFRQGTTEYETDISASNGAILTWKADIDE